jgi:hypothetical protein
MLKEVTSFNIAAGGVTELSRCDYCAEVEIRRTEDEEEMNDKLSLSIFTVEADREPVLAFRCKTYSEAETIGFDERLRTKLSTVKSGGVPLCDDLAIFRVRLAHPDERSLFEKAVSRSENVRIVYLVDLNEVEPDS